MHSDLKNEMLVQYIKILDAQLPQAQTEGKKLTIFEIFLKSSVFLTVKLP